MWVRMTRTHSLLSRQDLRQADSRCSVKNDTHSSERIVIPLVEEELRVEKRTVVTGRTRVRTLTETTEHLIREELSGERVEVERVPIDMLIETGAALPALRVEGNVT